MKKVLALLVVGLLLGCQSQSQKIDPEKRAMELLKLVQDEGFNQMKTTKTSTDEIVISDGKCEVVATFKDNSLIKITSTKINSTNEEPYSCVIKTLVRDQDLLGDNKDKFNDFMELFRTEKSFTFDKFKVNNDYVNFSIETVK